MPPLMSAWAMLWPLLVILLASVVGVAVVKVGLRIVRVARGKPAVVVKAPRCKCGYPLTNLDRIRCPECGKVIGFNSTPEELGLTDDELRRASEARERRRAATEAQPRS